jgi:hypothetical protein
MLLVGPSASFRFGGDPGWERKERNANCLAQRGFHSSLSFMEDGWVLNHEEKKVT